ncbi:MAG: hypothetical protein IJQ85_01620 [Selenomonadaceae bacterium]|nr:hypothetical protein [Selenomonadaceae bacterium]
MDNDKKILDELFQYGNRILTNLREASTEKSNDLENLRRRHENLRQNLKNLAEQEE